eukprot:TRINITY_DN18421_c0_g1_i1.p1 TRINITY_DN18421_c0_g1~~TRINITY_DN18421_c0_g1_i1.p1  ORF type:complete len:194 (-),score=41.10 TRINITY_DN18421_c0_g1_i1:423-1004(-)
MDITTAADANGFCPGTGTAMQSGFRTSFKDGSCVLWLFKGAVLNSSGKYAAAVAATLLVALLNEGVRWLRNRAVHGKTPFNGLVEMNPLPRELIHAALYVVQMCIAYALMLIFMTYEWLLCFAVLLGLGSGFFIFNWIESPPAKHKALLDDTGSAFKPLAAQSPGAAASMSESAHKRGGSRSRRSSATPCCDA